ncbi:MAG: CHASE2 domain-containing protein [Synechococcaceae cyanobacterium SM2_3_1]|nr:CHASE2 domain-containing protein [Synechococcaceae cyanobacterium SM2_3_1]
MKARHSPLMVGAGVSALAACGYLLNPWSLPDTLLYSQFFRWRGARPPHEDLVILAIDDDSLRVGELFEPEELAELPELAQLQTWPWPRAVYGMALEQLIQAGVQQVAFDLIFTDPSPFGPEDDQVFRQALERHAEQVTLGMKPQVFRSAQVEGVTAEVVETGLPLADLRVPGLKLGHVDMVIAPNQELLLLPQPLAQENSLLPPFAAAIADRLPPASPYGNQLPGAFSDGAHLLLLDVV